MKNRLKINKRKLKILGIILLLLTLPLILSTLYIIQNTRSSAAAPDKLETEIGVFSSSGVSKQNDNGASGGQFVRFDSSSGPTPIFQPNIGVGLANCTALDKGTSKINTPSLQMPEYLKSKTDPVFGTKITRVTGDYGTTIPNVSAGEWRATGGPTYSKIPAWNADMSLLLLRGTSAPGHLFLDGDSYEVVLYRRSLPNLSVDETRWHPTDSDQMIYVTTDGRVGLWNPVKNSIDQRFNPGLGYSSCKIGPWEGNVSLDGKMIVVSCGSSPVGSDAFFAVNLETGQKYVTIKASDIGLNQLDWASISPSGNYLVASRNSTLQKILTFTESKYDVIATIKSSVDHYDMTYDVAGNEVMATSDYSNAFFHKLSDGSKTIISNAIYSSGGDRHTSTRNLQVPGWAYSTQNGNSAPLDGEIIAMELKANGKIRRIVQHRATNSGYEHAAYGTPSPDGKRVLYRSDWGNGSGPVYGFVVDTRNICP